VIAGKSVRPLTRTRIVAALRARGLALPTPRDDGAES